MIPEELTIKIQDLSKTNQVSKLTTLAVLYMLALTETGFAKALESIDLVLHMLNGCIDEPDTEVDTDAYVDIVKDVNDFLLEYRDVITENINRNTNVDSLYYAGQVARISTRFQELNDKAPAAIDIHLIFPHIQLEDQDVVVDILSKLTVCVSDIEGSEDSMDWVMLQEASKKLYKPLLGVIPEHMVDLGSNRKNIDSVSMGKAKSFYDLWRLFDWNAFYDSILRGTEITLPPVDKDTHEPSDFEGPDSIFDRELRKLKNHHNALTNIKTSLSDKASEYAYADYVELRIDALLAIISYLIEKIPVEKAQNEAKIRIEERNRILANLSHSIKNMLKAVIGPLQTLREEIPEKAAIIDNAIKGANLIREIVNAINLSFNTSMDELNWDVLKPGKDSMTLQDMIADSLKYSIGNMFDFRYFPVYAENYFPRSLGKADFEGITSEWNQAQSSIDMVKDFCDRHLFKLELNLDDSRDYHVGNEKSSAIKLMILFQEMIFNAVKYTSFVPLEERTVQISLTRHDDKLRLMVRNSYSEKVRAKTTGVGKLVIENFAKVLGCEPKINTENNSYSIVMEFADIWRKHAEDSVH